jgi:hypothetical protein
MIMIMMMMMMMMMMECCSWHITKFYEASFLVNKPEKEYRLFHRLLAPNLLRQTNPTNKKLRTLISVKICSFQFKSLMLRVKEGTNRKNSKYLVASTSIYCLVNDTVSRSHYVNNFEWCDRLINNSIRMVMVYFQAGLLFWHIRGENE